MRCEVFQISIKCCMKVNYSTTIHGLNYVTCKNLQLVSVSRVIEMIVSKESGDC